MDKRALRQAAFVIAAMAAAVAGCASHTARGQRPGAAKSARGAAAVADKPDAGAGAHAAAAAPVPEQMRIVVSAEIDNVVSADDRKAQKTEIALVLTDQTGASRRAELGIFKGACNDVTSGADEAIPDVKNVVAIDCFHKGSGTRIRVIRRKGSLVVLRADVDQSTIEPAYNEMQRVAIPAGAAVRGQNQRR